MDPAPDAVSSEDLEDLELDPGDVPVPVRIHPIVLREPSDELGRVEAGEALAAHLGVAPLKEKNSKALRAISGVRGHGVGKSGGKDVIVVFIDQDSATLRAKLPKSLDGIDVHVRVTGNVTAY